MTIEEMETQLNNVLVWAEGIRKEIESLKNQENVKTYIPEYDEKYFYPVCKFDTGKYEPSKTSGAKQYQIDAFRTEEQCQRACNYLNMIMPVMKLAIENNGTGLNFMKGDNKNFMFEVCFTSEILADKAKELYEEIKRKEG